MRLAGLVDIAQEKNYQMIRRPGGPPGLAEHPAGDRVGVRAARERGRPEQRAVLPGSVAASRSRCSTRRPASRNIKVYAFNNANPMNGTAVPEERARIPDAERRGLVQSIGVDGVRVDAAKNMIRWGC